MSDHVSTQELINKIESADRKYRRSTTVLLVVIGIAIALSIFLQYQALEQFRQQSAQRSSDNKVLQEAIKRETEKTNQVLRCIAAYFANPDRSNTVIQNIDQCNIDPSTGAIIFDTEQNIPAGSGPASLTPGPAGTGPNTNTSNNPSNSSGSAGGGSGNDPDPDPDPETTPERNFIQRNVTDPIVNGAVDIVNGARGIIGL